MEGLEPANVAGTEQCIFCHSKHKEEKERKLPKHTFQRDDDALTESGRAFIRRSSRRSKYYPRDESGGFVSPLTEAVWPEDQAFKTYLRRGRRIRHAEKYQPPPIHGYIAAPHHMLAICCMNGTNDLPHVPAVNPWAKKGGYGINNGGNCIFLPGSASQFFVAYYLWKVRGTGRALQGHLGAHRKTYFTGVWKRLQYLSVQGKRAGWCNETESEDDKEKLAKRVEAKLHDLEAVLFDNLAALQPSDEFKLGAESYIAIPAEEEEFHVPADVRANLQRPYEILPKWY